MERSLGQDTKWLQDKEQELEWVTEVLWHVILQQFTQQTGTKGTVLLMEPSEAEAPRADRNRGTIPVRVLEVAWFLSAAPQ